MKPLSLGAAFLIWVIMILVILTNTSQGSWLDRHGPAIATAIVTCLYFYSNYKDGDQVM